MRDHHKIGFWTCTALIVGNVIGIGIFVLPASLAPFGFNALIGWVIVALGCLILAAALAYLARALPDAEGPYGYIHHALGELPAYLAMWAYWVSLWLTNAALATGVVGYLIVLFPALSGVAPALLALLVLWAAVITNLFGIRTGGSVQIVTTLLKLVPMLAIAALGAWVLVEAPTSYVSHPLTTPIAAGSTLAAATIGMYALLGFESASIPAARVDRPGRTIPRATMLGTVVVAIIYLIVSVIPLLLLQQRQLAASSAPYALLLDQFGIKGLGRWLALFISISGLGALNGWTLLVGELSRTMARNRVLPRVLARDNRQGAPVVALLVTGAFASAMIWMTYSRSLVAAFTFLTEMVTVANLPLYMGCALALFVLWMRHTATCRTGWVPMIATTGALFIVFIYIGAGRTPFLYGVGLCAAGLPLYVVMRMRHKVTPANAGITENTPVNYPPRQKSR